jgi:hypothetical protein
MNLLLSLLALECERSNHLKSIDMLTDIILWQKFKGNCLAVLIGFIPANESPENNRVSNVAA